MKLKILKFILAGAIFLANLDIHAQNNNVDPKEFPYYLLLTCKAGDYPTVIEGCFSGNVNTELELRNGSNYGLYKDYQINTIAKNTKDGYLINLRKNFELKAQNSSDSLILGAKIYKRSNNSLVFEKQVSRFGVIKVSN